MRRRMFLGAHYTIMTMDGHMAMKEGKVILIHGKKSIIVTIQHLEPDIPNDTITPRDVVHLS